MQRGARQNLSRLIASSRRQRNATPWHCNYYNNKLDQQQSRITLPRYDAIRYSSSAPESKNKNVLETVLQESNESIGNAINNMKQSVADVKSGKTTVQSVIEESNESITNAINKVKTTVETRASSDYHFATKPTITSVSSNVNTVQEGILNTFDYILKVIFRSFYVPDKAQDRFMTKYERLLYFSKGFRKFTYDWTLYKDINDVLETKEGRYWHGELGRRQWLHLRNFKHDFYRMGPVLACYVVPIVGYIPVLASFWFPQLVLTRQFLNEYEIRTYTLEEGDRKQKYYTKIAKILYSGEAQPKIVVSGSDTAGPIIDTKALVEEWKSYIKYLHMEDEGWNTDIPNNVVPRSTLECLAVATGIYNILPENVAKVVASIVPQILLRRRLWNLAYFLGKDDQYLIKTDSTKEYIGDLTDKEVLEACVARGIAIDDNNMNECLYNYIQMVKNAGHFSSPTQQGLFSLHLSILRCSMRNDAANLDTQEKQ